MTAIFWALAQVLALIFWLIYRLVTQYKNLDELRSANPAAGMSAGLTLVALAVVIGFPISMYASVVVFLPVAAVRARPHRPAWTGSACAAALSLHGCDAHVTIHTGGAFFASFSAAMAS